MTETVRATPLQGSEALQEVHWVCNGRSEWRTASLPRKMEEV